MHPGDRLRLNEKFLKAKEGKDAFLSKIMSGILKKQYSINEIFETRFPEYMLNATTDQEAFQKIVKTLELLCCKGKEEKEEQFILFLKKCSQLLFTKKEKEALKQILMKEFPQLNEEEEKGSKMLTYLLMYCFRSEKSSQESCLVD